MTCIVCNTGPLTHLWQINVWTAFRAFETIHVAEQVVREVEQHVALAQFETITTCALKVHVVSPAQIASCHVLLPGSRTLALADLATLVLAQNLNPDFVLTDDLALRQSLEFQKHKSMGSVGLLLYAYKVGLLNRETLDQVIDRLFVHSTLYLSPRFKAYVRKLIAVQLAK